jgi:hypothetical protein
MPNMLKTETLSDRPKEVDLDLERASNDVHLHNETIDTLSWDKISVKILDKATHSDKYLLNSIDGAASAGQSS